jgi:hypothetical protein
MSINLDLDRSLKAWLVAQAPERAPQRVLDVSRDRIRITRQRRSWWPAWRFPMMNAYAKLAIGVAAVAVIAVVGFNLLQTTGGQPVGGPAATPSHSRSAPTSSSPSPESGTWPIGALQAQRYHVMWEGVPLSFALPSLRWRSPAAGEIVAGTGTAMGVREDDYAWILPGMFQGDMARVATDPCNGNSVVVNGSTIDDLAAALTTIPGMSAEQPTDTTVGGLPAKVVTLTVDPDPPCDIDSFWMFGQTSLHPNSVDSIIRFWITAVDEQRYAFLTDQSAPHAENEQEIQQIIDSIQFE